MRAKLGHGLKVGEKISWMTNMNLFVKAKGLEIFA